MGYDRAATKLGIAFQDGGLYECFDVPESVNVGLLASSSKGSYFHQHIRPLPLSQGAIGKCGDDPKIRSCP